MNLQVGDIFKLRDYSYIPQSLEYHYLVLLLRERTYLTIRLEDGIITPVQRHFAKHYAEKVV
jgi:hypothetical protein